MVRVCSALSESMDSMSLLKLDGRKKLLTLSEASAGPRRPAAPKTFTFDNIFSQDASQAEVCSGAMAEVIQAVVNGADGCVFSFGHANLGKTYTMIGRDCSTQSLGVAPTAISWLFKVMEDRREKSGAGFSVRASAVEISGREEALTDLLSDQQGALTHLLADQQGALTHLLADQQGALTHLLADLACSSAGGQQGAVMLREDPLCGSQLQNQTELKATNAAQAAFLLDVAVAARRSSRSPLDQEARRNSHFLFTLHLSQERKDNKAATLGNVVLALANGAKHVPYRDSKLTMLLSESLSNINCRTTMIAHISDSPLNYMETLTTVQLASRIHRMRKKKSKNASSSSGGDSSCEEGHSHRPPHPRPLHPKIVALDPETPLLLSSDPDYSSSSEHSCDTVIYVGPAGAAISDRELSDNEGPPSFIPIIPSLNKKRVKDAPRPDREHLKCNTFAELQEKLDCIDAPATLSTEAKADTTVLRIQAGSKPTEATSPPTEGISSPVFLESTTTTQFPSAGRLLETSKRTSADGEKLTDTPFASCVIKQGGAFPWDSEPVVREKTYFRGGVPKPSASPSLPRTSREAFQPAEVVGTTPPVGMSQKALRQGQPLGSPNMERAHHLRAALLGRCLDRDFLRTTGTLQQPVELNGEDELVFTFVEELPLGFVPDNGRPSNLLSFNRDCSLQASRPVSIISSINDEYDAYTCLQGAVGPGDDTGTVMFSKHDGKESTAVPWPSEVSAGSAGSEDTRSTSRLFLRNRNIIAPDLCPRFPLQVSFIDRRCSQAP
ncbi:Kinesin-like protein KIF26A [Dissostichus eleginoides]|uniref:Kinesin-like protein KIF26A n=1 Tax=Dissostichus eleginoides TaxID=100907 RepID=A0AAD9EQR2_DISEL|nr:Kinesin-like protein KIF26A [Dissostichus eleginoides]